MNDGFDAIFHVRSYDCPKSRASRDKWLAHREAAGMPVVQQLQRFDTIPNEFQKQFERMRNRT